MSILEKIKVYKSKIIIIAIIISFISSVVFFLKFTTLLFVLSIPIILFLPFYKVFQQTIKSGLMGFLILITCMVYNPNIDKLNLFLKDEGYNNSDIKVTHNYDLLLFTYYRVEFSKSIYPSSNTKIKNSSKVIDKRLYIGMLKTFWNLTPRNTEKAKRERTERIANGEGMISNLINSISKFSDFD